MRFRWQNLNERPYGLGSAWRHGRCWLRGRRACFHAEWVFGCVGLRCYLTLGGEDDMKLSLAVPGLALYLSVAGLVPRWLRVAGGAKQTGFSVHAGNLWWSFWHPYWAGWSRRERTQGCVHLVDLLLGRGRYIRRVLEEARIEVPMPEGIYPATVTFSEHVTKRARWFTRRSISAHVVPDRAIPVPGKGESSYDIGEDAIYSLGCAADTPLKAVIATVESCLRTRYRHGGLNWRPAKAA
jgi:hypothetical protein